MARSDHRVSSEKQPPVIVIGAGIGGMATAARLARAGHTVEIHEAGGNTGGKCRTEWINGYAFDTGPSLLTLPAVYKDFFLKTGKRLEHVLELEAVNPSFDYRFADGKSVRFENLSHNKTVESIKNSLGSDAADSYHQLIERADQMWEASRTDFVERELISISALLKQPGAMKKIRTISPFASLRKLTRRYTRSPHIQKIMDRYATYTGSDPRKVPAVLLTIAFVEETFGAWHIKGGIGQLANALENRCRELGVTIHLNSPVKEIHHSSGEVVAVELSSGEKIPASIVIANADAAHVYNSLIPGKPAITRRPRRALKQAVPSLSGFSLLLGLRPDPSAAQLAHHTVFFPDDYDDEFDSIFHREQPVPDPAIYICAPKDSAMVSKEGSENWFVLVNAPRHDPLHGCDWNTPGLKERYAEQIISTLESYGLTIRDRLDVMEIRTPADLETRTLAPGGSIYGTSSNGPRAAFLRAKNRSPIKGLYCVGGSAHPGGGLPLVGISSEIVADAIGKPR
jgi:phytoene desaturase